MPDNSDAFLEGLIADLRPTAPLRQRSGMAMAVLALVLGSVLVIAVLGLRRDFLVGRPEPLVLAAAGIFLVLSLASAWTVVDMARPAVGTRREGWGWTALMAAVLPGSALVLMGTNILTGQPAGLDPLGYSCLVLGCGIGLLTAISLTTWIRRGAPSSPARAGLLIGVASGAAGIFAVSLRCPNGGMLHIGIWHGLTVVVMGILGRIALRRILAW